MNCGKCRRWGKLMPHRITLTLYLLPCVRPDYCLYWRIEAEDWYSPFLFICRWGWPGVVKRNTELSLLINIIEMVQGFFFSSSSFLSCACSFFEWHFMESHLHSFCVCQAFKPRGETSQERLKQTKRTTTSILKNPGKRMLNRNSSSPHARCSNTVLLWFTLKECTSCTVSLSFMMHPACTEAFQVI